MADITTQGYVAADGLRPRRLRVVYRPRSPMPTSAVSSTSSLSSPPADYELIPEDQLIDNIVYSSSGFTPTHQIKLKLEPERNRYKGSMSVILRAIMTPTNIALGSKQAVVCKEILEYGNKGTGEEGRIAADAYTTEHDCIVPYYDMGNGNLEGWIKTGETDDPAVYRQLTMDMIAGLNHLHAGDIVHGDIRANNVFLWRESTSHGLRLRAKIADFGLARYDAQIKPEEKRTKPTVRSRGDLRHLGFEHLSPDKPFPNWQKVSSTSSVSLDPISKQKPNDLWGLGMTILHLYSGLRPWSEVNNDEDVADLVKDGGRPRYPSGDNAFKRGLDFVLWRTLQDCWDSRPSCRPDTRQILDIWQSHSSRDLGEHQQSDTVSFVSPYWIDLSNEIQRVAGEPVSVSGREELAGQWEIKGSRGTGHVLVRLVRPPVSATSQGGWNKEFRTEISRWRKLRHDNLRPLLGVYFEPNSGSWHAVVHLHISFRSWSERRAKNIMPDDSPAGWLRLLFDVANALNYLHMQRPPIIHGAVHADNVICPRDVMTLPETRFSVHSCLSDFRSVKLAPSGDTSQDVEAYGRLVVEVMNDWAARFTPSPVKPALLDTIIGGCSQAGSSILKVAVFTLDYMLRTESY